MKTYEEIAKEVLRRRDEEAAQRRSQRKRIRVVCCAAAGVCAAALLCVGMWRGGVFGSGRRHWPVREVNGSSGNGEIAVLPKWEEMSISQQFGELNYRGVRYSTRVTALAAGMSGDCLTQVEMVGYDTDAGITHRTTGTVYAIRGISEECAVAVSFAGTDGCYVYVNSYYSPSTLGQMLDDLDLQSHMTFGSVWYTFCDEKTQEYINVEFVNVPDSIVWEMLLSDRSPVNQPEPNGMLIGEMSVSVNIPILGYQNISLSVSRSGWLSTNILETGKYFFIGSEQVNLFMEYVIEHCEGYEIRYADGTGNAVPE